MINKAKLELNDLYLIKTKKLYEYFNILYLFTSICVNYISLY